ncbi:MAG: hypothetical protein WD558_08475 [Pseudomonadales bacterium]
MNNSRIFRYLPGDPELRLKMLSERLRKYSWLFLFLLALTRPGSADTPLTVSSEHFEFESYGAPAVAIRDIQVKLEENYDRILRDLGLSNLPRIKVVVWSNLMAFTNARTGAMGTHEPASYFIHPGDDRMIIGLMYTRGMDLAELLHQFTHIATLQVNPDLRSSSRWLWESLALYHARQFYPPSQLSCISLSDAPSLGWLNVPAHHETLRRVGYLLGDFLANEYETDTLIKLVRQPDKLQQVLKVSEEEFESDWHRFIANRYLSSGQIPSILSDLQINQEVAGNTFYFEDGRTLYLRGDHGVTIAEGDHVQTGVWTIEGQTRLCWQVLNFDKFCTRFRMTGNQFWLDTLSDCQRYSLRREIGNAENY